MSFLEMKNISKRFGDVLANDQVFFDLNPGEVHALLGENGAGKTTLMNILYGLCTPDHGEIWLKGSKVEISSPHQAIELHIGMIHQHFMLIPRLTVTENIILGLPSSRPPFLQHRKAESSVDQIAKRYGLSIDPRALVTHLPIGLQQRVEILRALYRKSDILILDEPTSVLSPLEIESLFSIIKKLIRDGVSVIFISHKLNEVTSISDRVTILRRGRVVGTTKCSETDHAQLANMMVGKEISLSLEKQRVQAGERALEVRSLTVESEKGGKPALKGVSLDVRSGEVLGIAGVDGNGQFELAEAIAGLLTASDGQIVIKGRDVTALSPGKRIAHKLGYIPADRQRVGAIMDFSVAENLVLKNFRTPPFTKKRFILDKKSIEANANRIIKEYNVKVPHGKVKIAHLSGGNQQKVILAREISDEPEVLLAMHPTRGLDFGSTNYVRRRILEQRTKGRASLFISADLEEIVAISDRIAVMYEGEIMGILPGGEDADLEKLGMMMAGVCREDTGKTSP